MSSVAANLLPAVKLIYNPGNSSCGFRVSSNQSGSYGSCFSLGQFAKHLVSNQGKGFRFSRYASGRSRSFSFLLKCVAQKSDQSVSVNSRGNGAIGNNSCFASIGFVDII